MAHSASGETIFPTMANSASASKRARQAITRTERNKSTRSRVRNAKRACIEAIEAGDSDKIAKSYSAFASAADKAAKTNVIHKSAANRLKSRLASKVNKAASA